MTTDEKGTINRLKKLSQRIGKKPKGTPEEPQPEPEVDETDVEEAPPPPPRPKVKKPFEDPLEGLVDPEDRAMVEATMIAKARQEAAHAGAAIRPLTPEEHDAQREAAMITQRKVAEAHNLVSPSDMLKSTAHIPNSVPGTVSIWVVVNEEDTKMLYAPDWKTLKAKLKARDGVWKIKNFSFQATALTILGFFFPNEFEFTFAPVETFDVLVQSGIVFRSDSE